MKKNILTLFLILLMSIILISCKSSNGHCDAYGNKSANAEELEFDIYNSHNNSMVKYTTTTSIK